MWALLVFERGFINLLAAVVGFAGCRIIADTGNTDTVFYRSIRIGIIVEISCVRYFCCYHCYGIDLMFLIYLLSCRWSLYGYLVKFEQREYDTTLIGGFVTVSAGYCWHLRRIRVRTRGLMNAWSLWIFFIGPLLLLLIFLFVFFGISRCCYFYGFCWIIINIRFLISMPYLIHGCIIGSHNTFILSFVFVDNFYFEEIFLSFFIFWFSSLRLQTFILVI